jgi:simple sugar transport system ATP-binding protein
LNEIMLEARDLTVTDDQGIARVRGVTLQVRGGEILGIAGVEGGGQHELLRALAGRLQPTSGTLTRPERIGFVPEDRHRDALVLDFTLAENIAPRGGGERRGVMQWGVIRRHTEELIERFQVRAEGAETLARTLSGGNQQKLVLARELDDSPHALIVENPTRGLDLAATAAVHQRLREGRNAGAAVVVYSSDLDEVLALADRVLVMFAGTGREVVVDRRAVGEAMLGVA